MAAVGEAAIKIVSDMTGFGPNLERELKKQTSIAEREGQRAGHNFGSGLTSGAKLALAGGIAVVGAFAVASVKAFDQAEKSETALNFAFSKFPKLADVSRKSIDDLALSIATHTKFSKFDVQATAATLAQFSLTGKQVEQVLPLVADYAAKTGKDLPEAASLLGRALLGNTRALKAIGINLKISTGGTKDLGKAQTALAKAQEHLTQLEARLGANRKITLSESIALQRAETALNDARAGGNADKIQRAEQTLSLVRDRIQRSTHLTIAQQQELTNAQDAVAAAQGKVNSALSAGSAAGSAFDQVIGAVKSKVGGFARVEGKTFADRLIILKNDLKLAEAAVGKFIVSAITPLVNFVVDHVVPAFLKLAPKIGAIGSALSDAAKGGVKAFFDGFNTDNAKHAQKRVDDMSTSSIRLKDVMDSFHSVMKNDVDPVLTTFGQLLSGTNPVMNNFADTVANAFHSSGGAILGFVGVIANFHTPIQHGIRDVIGAFESFGRFIDGFVERFRLVFQGFGDIFGGILTVARSTFSGAIAIIGGAIRTIAGLVTGNFKAAIHGFEGIFSGIGRFISGTIGGTLRSIIGFLEVVVGAFTGIIGKLFNVGSEVARGFFEGIIHTIGKLASHLPGFLKHRIPDEVRKFFGIHSPSKLMFDIGTQVGLGFNLGVLDALQKQSLATALHAQMASFGAPKLQIPSGPHRGGDGASLSPITIISNQDPRVIANEVLFKQARLARR